MSENIYDFSIIIPTRNPDIARFMNLLKSIDLQYGARSELYSYEVLIADDDSEESLSSSKFKNLVFNYKTYSSSKRKGEGYSVKKAIQFAKGNYIIFLNESCIFNDEKSLYNIYKNVVKNKNEFTYLSSDRYSFIVKRDKIISDSINFPDKLDYTYYYIQSVLFNYLNEFKEFFTVEHLFHHAGTSLDNIPVNTDFIDINNFKETESLIKNNTNGKTFLESNKWLF